MKFSYEACCGFSGLPGKIPVVRRLLWQVTQMGSKSKVLVGIHSIGQIYRDRTEACPPKKKKDDNDTFAIQKHFRISTIIMWRTRQTKLRTCNLKHGRKLIKIYYQKNWSEDVWMKTTRHLAIIYGKDLFSATRTHSHTGWLKWQSGSFVSMIINEECVTCRHLALRLRHTTDSL